MVAVAQDDRPRERPLRRSEYDRLVELGVFDGQRIELVRGKLIQMSPQKLAHANACVQVHRLLDRLLDGRADVRGQVPFIAADESEPEPDVAVVPVHAAAHDHPSSAYLLVEIADSSLEYDRRKAALYAESAIPEYWIVNLVDGVIEIHRTPRDGVYTQRTLARRGESVAPAAFPDAVLAVDDLLPKS